MKSRHATMIMVRHGETERNAAPDQVERVRGWDNVPLNARGQQQAEEIGRKLSAYRIATIYSSNLRRALETAEAIQRLSRATPRPRLVRTVSLRPWFLGDFQGQPYDKVRPLVEGYQLRRPTVAVPGGESFHDFMARYMKFMMAKLKEAETTGDLLVFVAHTRNMRGFKAWVKTGLHKNDVDLEHMVKQQDAPTGGATLLEVTGDKVRLTEL
jgi:probable phosphoglycerate mutase